MLTLHFLTNKRKILLYSRTVRFGVFTVVLIGGVFTKNVKITTLKIDLKITFHKLLPVVNRIF